MSGGRREPNGPPPPPRLPPPPRAAAPRPAAIAATAAAPGAAAVVVPRHRSPQGHGPSRPARCRLRFQVALHICDGSNTCNQAATQYCEAAETSTYGRNSRNRPSERFSRPVIDPAAAQERRRAGHGGRRRLRDGHVAITLEVDPARGTALEPMRQACRAGRARHAGRAVGDRGHDAPSAPRPAAPASHAHGHGHAHGQGAPAAKTTGGGGRIDVPGVKHIIAVASGKGGVGKSTVAVNLALGACSQRASASGCSTPTSTAPRCRACSAIAGKPGIDRRQDAEAAGALRPQDACRSGFSSPRTRR